MSVVSAKRQHNSNAMLVDLSFIWTIKNFSSILSGELYQCLEVSHDDTEEWTLTALVENRRGNVSIIISPSFGVHRPFEDESSKLTKCVVSILDSEKRKTLTKIITETFTSVPKHQIKFRDISYLCKENHLRNDELNIHCRIIRMDENIKIDKTPVIDIPTCDLNINFSTLLESGMFSDVILSCQEKDFPAHKSILTCRSSVFKAMFTHEMTKNTDNRIIISDVSPKVLQELLHYIYSGRCGIQYNMAADFMNVAEKYSLPRLKMMIANVLWNTLSADNACEVFIIAEMYGISKLKKLVINFIRFNKCNVEFTDGWKLIVENPTYLKNFE